MPKELHNLFVFKDGSLVDSQADWPRRRRELLDTIVPLLYGNLPAAPEKTTCEVLHGASFPQLEGIRQITIRVVAGKEPAFSFLLYLLLPPGSKAEGDENEGPYPVIINGDQCWRMVTDDIIRKVASQNMILAQFNRCEMAADVSLGKAENRNCGLYRHYPNAEFGALAAWAWGFHRCVDVLAELPYVDASKIAVTGHSRGGKTALLAGATDERIALTWANNSGAAGAGSFLFSWPESETLADCLNFMPHWYSEQISDYAEHPEKLPFDQHFLKAAVAPRAFFSTEAFGDLWANPKGTFQTHQAAREAYRFLDAEDKIGIWYREGEHDHTLADWEAFLAFANRHFKGQPGLLDFHKNPFADLPSAFSWSAPKMNGHRQVK